MYLTMSPLPEQRRAMVCLIFGFVQMFGAVFALTLILWTGVTVCSLCALVATGPVTATSLVLFRCPDHEEHNRELFCSTRLHEEKDVERRTTEISNQ
jgi:hypothetical protein